MKQEHTVLKATTLSIGYKTKKEDTLIADKIDFSLKEGEITAIVGINGVGKSTLLRTLGNIQPKLQGIITLNGKAIENYSPLALASQISIVLTEPIASKNLTVLELIALARQPYTNWIGTLTVADKSKITKAVQMIQLETLQHKKCYELSDGQLQKVMIARALAQDTAIILLDEPTSHLDMYHKASILKLLKNIAHQTKKTVLFTTHEIDTALQICDKMLVLGIDHSNFGTPLELINAKCFEKLFPEDIITFDADSRSFKIK